MPANHWNASIETKSTILIFPFLNGTTRCMYNMALRVLCHIFDSRFTDAPLFQRKWRTFPKRAASYMETLHLMPELPEVETYVRELQPELMGCTITQASVFWLRTIAEPGVGAFLDGIRQQQFTCFDRRGKYMLLGFQSQQTLIVHLRMTGELHIYAPTHALYRKPDKHTHVVFDLDDGRQVHYRDQRKFGRIWLVADREQIVGALGPEPLDGAFTPQRFAQALRGRRASIKTLLLNQAVLAGVGNIYADEALFRAGIHPQRGADQLDAEEIEKLHGAVQFVLRRGIELKGSSLQNYVRLDGLTGNFQDEHQVFRKSGQPCPQCGAPIERVVVAQRSTHFCPRCQPFP